MLKEVRELVVSNGEKSDAIATSLNENTKTQMKTNVNQFETPKGNSNTKQVPRYSTILKSSSVVSQSSTLTSAKRRRNEIELVDNKSTETVLNAKLPTPKTGKKNVQIGKPLEPKKMKAFTSTTNQLTKSIWVSKLHTETTVTQMEEFIAENTPVTDKTKLK